MRVFAVFFRFWDQAEILFEVKLYWKFGLFLFHKFSNLTPPPQAIRTSWSIDNYEWLLSGFQRGIQALSLTFSTITSTPPPYFIVANPFSFLSFACLTSLQVELDGCSNDCKKEEGWWCWADGSGGVKCVDHKWGLGVGCVDLSCKVRLKLYLTSPVNARFAQVPKKWKHQVQVPAVGGSYGKGVSLPFGHCSPSNYYIVHALSICCTI